MTRRGAVLCLMAAVLFGASTPAASVLARDVPPVLLAGILYLGAAIAVLPFVVRRVPTMSSLRASWKPLSVAVVAGGAIGPVLLVLGLTRVDAATASLLLNLELIATLAIATVWMHEHLTRRVVVGATLITAGGVLLVWDPGAHWTAGALFVVGACICWGIDNSVTARVDQISAETIVMVKGAVAGSVNAVLGTVLAAQHGATLTLGQLAGALVVGALGYGASIVLWVRGARLLGAARAQLFFATAPFIGAAVAWTLLGEPIAWIQGVALLAALVGVALAVGGHHEHLHIHDAAAHDHEHLHPDEHHNHAHDPLVVGWHSHFHVHDQLVHEGAHIPDVHHHHRHD
ncbi:MAG: EamA family transporter [Acidimicrobiia bacterium]